MPKPPTTEQYHLHIRMELPLSSFTYTFSLLFFTLSSPRLSITVMRRLTVRPATAVTRGIALVRRELLCLLHRFPFFFPPTKPPHDCLFPAEL